MQKKVWRTSNCWEYQPGNLRREADSKLIPTEVKGKTSEVGGHNYIVMILLEEKHQRWSMHADRWRYYHCTCTEHGSQLTLASTLTLQAVYTPYKRHYTCLRLTASRTRVTRPKYGGIAPQCSEVLRPYYSRYMYHTWPSMCTVLYCLCFGGPANSRIFKLKESWKLGNSKGKSNTSGEWQFSPSQCLITSSCFLTSSSFCSLHEWTWKQTCMHVQLASVQILPTSPSKARRWEPGIRRA